MNHIVMIIINITLIIGAIVSIYLVVKKVFFTTRENKKIIENAMGSLLKSDKEYSIEGQKI